jgi:hypothetical protein
VALPDRERAPEGRQTRRAGVAAKERDCIGRFDPEFLSKEQVCVEADPVPPFVDGGRLEAHVSLEEADRVVLTGFEMTLCAALAVDVEAWGEEKGDITRCRRENGVIAYRGDWCEATDAPADEGCADSMRFEADFAASAVEILD